MSFYRAEDGVYRVRELDRFGWLQYGFGTRHARGWPPQPAAIVKQIHSNLCVVADGRPGVLGRADALITRSPGTWLAIRTADCVPMLYVDERLRAVAAVHAGWRGSAANIAAAAVAALCENFGTRPEDLNVAIGPAICGRCYEVGPEVAAQFDAADHVDLAEVNRRQLIEAGVAPERIVAGAPCTKCHAEEFFSHRREPENRGRMVSAIALAP